MTNYKFLIGFIGVFIGVSELFYTQFYSQFSHTGTLSFIFLWACSVRV